MGVRWVGGFMVDDRRCKQKESIPVGCLPPACWLYMWWLPLGASGDIPTHPRHTHPRHTHPWTYPTTWSYPTTLVIPNHPGHTHSPWTYPPTLDIPNPLESWDQTYPPLEKTWNQGYLPLLWTEWLTDACENITFRQLRWRAVTNQIHACRWKK